MCSLADKREWILFRTSHVTTHKDDDPFLIYFHAFTVSAFKCLCFVIQQVRIYSTVVGIKGSAGVTGTPDVSDFFLPVLR